MTAAVIPLRPRDDWRNALALNVSLQRRFLLIDETEPVELTCFVGGRPRVAFAVGERQHVSVLQAMEALPGYQGAYQLVNRHTPEVAARYPAGVVSWPDSGRVSDSEITHRRALYFDVDPVRPKGISATDGEKAAAFDVASELRGFLEARFGRTPIGFGSSGNGSFILLAIEPIEPDPEQAKRIGRLLAALNDRFGTDRVTIDRSVFNAARLMPAAGTMKRKGTDTPERPHRRATFSCSARIDRVPLAEVIG